MTSAEMLEFTAILNARWPSKPKGDIWAKAWLRAFAPYPLERALVVLDSIQPQGGSPEAHEVLMLLRDQGLDEDGLVGDVLRAVRVRGYLATPDASEWRSPAIVDAIEAFGGWYAVCIEHDLGDPATRAQFRNVIRARLAERRARGDVVVNEGVGLMPARWEFGGKPLLLDDPNPPSGEFVPMPPEAKAALEALGEEAERRGSFARRNH